MDSLGYRMKFAVVAPSTNTSVQPEYDNLRPRGVTNHFARIAIPDTAVTDDASFMVMLNNIRAATLDTVDVAMSMQPGCVVMGMSAETFWDGAAGAQVLQRRLEERTGGVPVIMGSTAVERAIRTYGNIRRIGIVTPYMTIGDANVRRYFEDQGYEVERVIGLKSPSPMLIAHENEQTLKAATIAAASGADAVIQCGDESRLRSRRRDCRILARDAGYCDQCPRLIGMPCCTMGISDQRDGAGRLFADF